MRLHKVDEGMAVAGQIAPEEVAALAEAGVALILNNRPDGEEPGQPAAAAVAAAARAAGIGYRHIPVAGGFSEAQVEETARALAEAQGPVLAFCRSGTRSIYLWALARKRLGDEGEELIAKAAAAGYDLGPIAAYLR